MNLQFLIVDETAMVSKKALEEFKSIYGSEFQEKLSDDEALEKATKFLNLMRVITKPIPIETGKVITKSMRYEVA